MSQRLLRKASGRAVPGSLRPLLCAVLLAVAAMTGRCAAETPAAETPAAETPAPAWPQWRGPHRDGIAAWLPERLPAKPKILWKMPTTGSGLSGIAATDRHVIVADRCLLDHHDVFRCLDADSGAELWKLQYPAPGELDYGNSARATPLIHDGKVYLLGALGDLHCVKLSDGKPVWRKNLWTDFAAKGITWGACASPLLVDDKLIVNPGGREASLVALNRLTGEVVWRSPGLPAAYSSFIVGRFGGVRQIVGYDAISLGGWDVATGRRLWQLLPPEDGDFNVPTPVEVDGKLLLSSENNGTRLYEFDRQGKIVPRPIAVNEDLAPDSSTPVVIGDHVFGVWTELFCLDVKSGLKARWTAEDEAFEDYVSIIGSGDRLLITSAAGELLLVRCGGKEEEGNEKDGNEKKYELISRLRLFGEDSEVLSHPALVGHRLYVRDHRSVCCVLLDAD